MNQYHEKSANIEHQEQGSRNFGSCTAGWLQTLNVRPLRGRLQHLRTKAEVLHQDETLEMYFCAIEAREASKVLSIIKSLPNQLDNSLLHLRRFVKPPVLPRHLQQQLDQESDTNSLSQPLYVLLAPTATIDLDILTAALATQTAASQIHIAAIPRHPPSSPAHAAHLTAAQWPTIFTNTNPFGPHYALVDRATATLKGNAALLMGLARTAGSQAAEDKQGLCAGVVVTEGEGAQAEIVAVAGDGRFAGSASGDASGDGGDDGRRKGAPALHAVMRAIALVARKRRALASASASAPPSPFVSALESLTVERATPPQQDTPLTTLEAQVLALANLRPDGYLCQHLTFYVTHEPCVMCSMALVHSRVERVVVGVPGRQGERVGMTGGAAESGEMRQKGDAITRRRTGGLVVGEDGEGYGLFWRAELNWRFLCWGFVVGEDEQEQLGILHDDVHV